MADPTPRKERGRASRRPSRSRAANPPRPASLAPPAADAGERLVPLAAVAGAHGVRGEVRLKLFAESIDSLRRHAEFIGGGVRIELIGLRDTPRGPIARFAGIDDRAAAEALRGMLLAVPRAALPPLGEGEYYHADLIGLPCRSSAGEELGQSVALENYGAGDILEIERADGGRFMVPMHAVEVTSALLSIDAAFVP